MKNTIKGEIFVFIVSFIAFLMGIISRIGFEYDNQHLLNSFFVITFLIFFPISFYVYLNKYHIYKWYLSKIFLLFIGFLFILLLSYLSKLFEINFIYIVYFFSIIFLVYCLLKKYTEFKFNLFFLIFSLFFGLFITSAYYGNYYLNPIIYEQITTGSWNHRDIVYHASISGMFKTYSFASTGLDGFVPHTYHKLSHIIIGLLSLLVNTNTLIFYSLDITIIIIPLFLLSFIFATNEANIYFANNFNFSLNDDNKIGYWLVIFTLFALPIPVNFLVEKYSYVQSQSYLVGLIFGFIFIGIFFSYINSTDNFLEKFQKEKILFKIFFFFMLFILISASFFSKISFLYIFNILGLFFYLRMKLYKFIFINVSVFFWIIFMFLLYRYWIIHFSFTVYAIDFDFKVLLNHLFIRELNFFKELTFIFFSFLYILIKIIVYKKHLKLSFFENLKRKNFIDIEILIILIFSLYIINYEYFKGIQIYISYILILSHYELFKKIFFERKT